MGADNKYKSSYYNLVINESETTVHIWNVKHGSVIELETPLYEELKQNRLNSGVLKYRDALIKEGIIVPESLDEQQEIIFSARQRQYSIGRDSFGLVLAPTLNCNYHCPYCFERGVERDGYMSDEVQQTLIRALSEKLEGNTKIKRARITWFGGEPLLAYDKVIVPLQKSIIELCKKLGIQTAFSIITNGYYLTSEKYDFLFKDCNTKFVQITLDGSENDYAKRKATAVESFRRVVENVLDLSEYVHKNKLDVNLNIRLNADNTNYPNIKELVIKLKIEKRFQDNINFSLERLREYGPCQSLNNYCSTEEFENLKFDFDDFVGKPLKFFEPKPVFCGQHCMNVFCIGVNGEIYKCEHDFGVPEHAIGNIKYGLSYNRYFSEFMDQPLPEKCMTCQILPVCMGGCPHRRLENHGCVECDYTIKNVIKSARRFVLGKEVK